MENLAALSMGNEPLRSITRERLSGKSSMAMKCCPLDSPTSKMRTTLGWLMEAAIRASLWNRSRYELSTVRRVCNTLTATIWFVRESKARKTDP